jgi:hypothetical protein
VVHGGDGIGDPGITIHIGDVYIVDNGNAVMDIAPVSVSTIPT